MVKMPRKKPEKPQPKQVLPEEADDALPDRYIWLSLLLLFIAGYLAVSTISYLVYWDVDQNIAKLSNWFADAQQDALNWGGRIGAVAADHIMGRWFGIFGLLLPVIIFFMAIKLLRIKALRLRRAIGSTLLMMIVGSIAAGHIFGADPDVFGSGWGGTHGIFISQWLSAMIGREGTTLLLIALLLGTLYYAFNREVWDTVRKIKAFRKRRREKRQLKEELRMLQNQERLAGMRTALEQQRQETAKGGPVIPVSEILPKEEPKEKEGEEEPSTAPERVLAADVREIPGPSQAEEIPLTEKQVELPVKPHVESVPVDYARLISYEDGSYGYLMGYDQWDVEVIYRFDKEGTVYTPETTEEPKEDEIELTLETRTPKGGGRVIVEEEIQAVPNGVETVVSEFVVEQPEEEQLDNAVIDSESLYDPTLELRSYRKPRVELLDDHTRKVTVTDEELVENKNRILKTLDNFGIKIDTIEATIGPTVTLYEIIPAPGVRISRIKNLEDDIALSLSALGIRIIAPIPGKGTIGIEVPNKDKEVVSMYSVIKSPKFHESTYDLPVALGKTISNETYVFDLTKMPHLLVAGATGQGKSVGLNAIITSLLYKKHPAELKFVLVDPKKVELTLYARLEKHFLAKMPESEEAIITDTQKVIYTLNSLCIEMDARYDLLKAAHVRNIKEYNDKFTNRRLNPEKGHRYLPYFVVVVDEFADLIMTAGREIETPIARLAQLARAVGIHLIIATQRPTTNIITGVIKANFPARIAFRVTSMIDSRTILDQPGANQLIGRGDMLISTGNDVTRVQCAFIDTPEVERITEHIAAQKGYQSAYELPEYTPESDESGSAMGGDTLAKRDPLFEEVAHYVVNNQTGSASTIQRKFSIGFNRAGRIVDQLEAAGIVGRNEGGGKPRQVLVSDPMSLGMILDNLP